MTLLKSNDFIEKKMIVGVSVNIIQACVSSFTSYTDFVSKDHWCRMVEWGSLLGSYKEYINDTLIQSVY